MDEDEQKSELQALVVGFLQQSLKDNPEGFSLAEFERFFPERCDEPHDWYRRYNKSSALDALKWIPDSVKVTHHHRYNCIYISLNLKSAKVDTHLIDLIKHQKSSSKRRPSRPSSRARASFSLNRQYASYHSRGNFKLRLNHGQYYNGDNFIRHSSPPLPTVSRPQMVPPSIYTKAPARMASGDPRNRSSSSHSSRPSSSSQRSNTNGSSSSVSKSTAKVSAHSHTSPLTSDSSTKQNRMLVDDIEDNSTLEREKMRLGQRIASLLNRKFNEIKLVHLLCLYKLEYQEDIVPTAFNHKTLTSLLGDPKISEYVQLHIKAPFPTVSAKRRPITNGKENLFVDSVKDSVINKSDRSSPERTQSYAKSKLDAIGPFNVRTMLESLEPLGQIVEPPLKSFAVDDSVKYKTLRMIFKSPDQTLKIDDWEQKFYNESKCKIRIRDYSFKTNLEFFKSLAKDLPIKVLLNKQDEWIAVVEMDQLSQWINLQMRLEKYRAITSLEYYYDLIAFPSDRYNFVNPSELSGQDFQPSMILSVNPIAPSVQMSKRKLFSRSNGLWIQLRTPKVIENHLCVEASLTCYEDYKTRDHSKVPGCFVRPGFPCVAYDTSQQRWCRALVLALPPEANGVIDKNYEITVLLVDYGIVKNFAVSQLLNLVRAHLKLPVGPIYAKIHGIGEETLVVQKHLKMVLQEYTSPPVTLACKFMSLEDSQEPNYLPKYIANVVLVDTRQGRDCNLADNIKLLRDTDN